MRGGPIGLVKNGDIISIDIPNGVLNIEVSEDELSERQREWVTPEPKINWGYLGRYAKLVTSASTGAVFK